MSSSASGSPAIGSVSTVGPRFAFVPWLLGCVLILAANLKGYDLATQPVIEAEIVGNRWFLLAIVGLELGLGFWLLSGLHPTMARTGAILCFTVFLGVALHQAISGKHSCGCFGRVSVRPQYVFGLDVLALLGLWLWRPAGVATRNSQQLSRYLLLLGLLLLVSAPVATVALTSAPGSRITETGTGDSQVVVFDPASWVGQRFPLLGDTDVGDQLNWGQWVVLFYRRDCAACEKLIADFQQKASSGTGREDAVGIAFIEVPAVNQGGAGKGTGTRNACLQGRLRGGPEWFIQTPAILLLNDGALVRVLAPEDPPPLAAAEFPQAPENAQPAVSSRRTAEASESSAPSPRVAGFTLFPDYERVRRLRYMNEIACGPLSLLAVLQHLGVKVSAEQRNEIIAAAGSKGTSLLTLAELARKYGLSTVGAEVSLATLRKIGLPAIAHLHGSEFVAVTGYPGGGVEVVHPLKAPRVEPEAKFEEAFGQPGRVLFLSTDSISASSLGLSTNGDSPISTRGPRLRLGQTALTVGRIFGHRWEEGLALYNDGDAPLHIQQVVASCKCITASVDRETIPPQGSVTLRVKGEQGGFGGFSSTLALVTNESGHTTIKIPVRGYLEPPVLLESPAVVLEQVPVGASAKATVLLDLGENISPASLRAKIPQGAPVRCDIQADSPGRAQLLLTWHGSSTVGWHRQRIDIDSEAVPACAVTPLSLAVEVVTPMEVFPPSLVIRDSELSSSWERQVTFRSRQGQAVQDATLRWSDSVFGDAIVARQTSTLQGKLQVTLAPVSQAKAHILRGKRADLILTWPDSSSCRVSVWFGRENFVSQP